MVHAPMLGRRELLNPPTSLTFHCYTCADFFFMQHPPQTLILIFALPLSRDNARRQRELLRAGVALARGRAALCRRQVAGGDLVKARDVGGGGQLGGNGQVQAAVSGLGHGPAVPGSAGAALQGHLGKSIGALEGQGADDGFSPGGGSHDCEVVVAEGAVGDAIFGEKMCVSLL